MALDSSEEQIEEVAPDGSVVRVVTRAQMRAARLRHRCVYIAVVDDRGRLLIHQRSWEKDLWPGRWDICAGGVVAAGEPWDVAARRELAEEVGLTVDITEIGRGAYDDADAHSVGVVYRAQCTAEEAAAVRFADGEVIAAEWVDRTDLIAAMGQRTFVPDSQHVVLPLLDGALAE